MRVLSIAGIEDWLGLCWLWRRADVRLWFIEAGRGFDCLLGEGERLRGRSEVWIFGFEGVFVVDIVVVSWRSVLYSNPNVAVCGVRDAKSASCPLFSR